jgi:hypothetical protein
MFLIAFYLANFLIYLNSVEQIVFDLPASQRQIKEKYTLRSLRLCGES